jgi:phospholipase C
VLTYTSLSFAAVAARWNHPTRAAARPNRCARPQPKEVSMANKLAKIKHVVVLILENRSFDHRGADKGDGEAHPRA